MYVVFCVHFFQVPVLRENDGTEIRGFVSVAKHLTRNSNHMELLGSLSPCISLFISCVRLVPVLS